MSVWWLLPAVVWIAFACVWRYLRRPLTPAEQRADDAAQMRALAKWAKRHDR